MESTALRAEDQFAGALPGDRLANLRQAVAGMSSEQLTWASGYLAGLGASALSLPTPQSSANEETGLTVLYATQGGNAREIAESLAAAAEKRGLAPRLVAADQYRPRDLGKEGLLLAVISTQGEGDPPDSARELFKYLSGKKAPDLSGLRFAVFGLGDSSYEFFNQAGKDLDRLLRECGARALSDRVDADVDFHGSADDWRERVLRDLEQERPEPPRREPLRIVPLTGVRAPAVGYDRKHPYHAELIENRRITSDDAVGEVYHLVLEIDPDAIQFQPGDAVGVDFRNDPRLIEEILDLTALSGDEPVLVGDESLPLAAALTQHLELTQLHPGVAERWAELAGNDELDAIVAEREQLRCFAQERQLVDLIAAYPALPGANELVGLLHKRQNRLFSIASSQAAQDDELHLTVCTLAYRAHGRDHLGGASGYLTRRAGEGEGLDIYIAENTGFRLPDDDAPVILVGAGTGIAPFRAFLQERAARGAGGRNWLVFGNRHFHRDFLYQTDWLSYRETGLLNKISLAFSRDQAERVYVQDKLRAEGADLYHWLQEGARLYVCGGIDMEREVRRALGEIARVQGNLNADAAAGFVDVLRDQGRYLRDVY